MQLKLKNTMEKYVINEKEEEFLENGMMIEEASVMYGLDLFAKNNSENTEIEINRFADIIYKNYLLIKKAVDENNLSPKITMFVNVIILLKIVGSFRKNVNGIAQNQLLKEFMIAECNITFDSSMTFNIDTVKKISLNIGFDIDTVVLDKIIDNINAMNIPLLVNYHSGNINRIFGQVFEKIITKKEIGAYYTGENTTKYITENTVIPSCLMQWAKYDIVLNKYLADYKAQNGLSIIENSIKNNISLKKLLFDLIQKFDNWALLKTIQNIKIIDISCGSGSFIFSSYYLLKEILGQIKSEEIDYDYSKIFENNLFGIDIDEEAIHILKFRILIENVIETKTSTTYLELINNFIVGNSLIHNKSRKKDLLFSDNNKKNQSIFESNLCLVNIVDGGGFDVVLGNPPYLEYKNITSYKIENYRSEKCNNLYAFVLEKNFDILKEEGHLGMIIPISYISTKRMKPIRSYLIENSNYQFCSNYADRPSCLFNGVHQKLNIILLEKQTSQSTKKVYTTNYLHWYAESKDEIYNDIHYKENKFVTSDFLFKIGNQIEESIIQKLCFSSRKSLVENFVPHSNHTVWLNMRMTFWNKSFMKPQKSNEYKAFFFQSSENAMLFSALLNSNIFFFYWECISDVWHITLKDLSCLRVDFASFSVEQKEQICNLYQELETNLELNKKKIDSKQTEFEYQHKKDKILIDKIDLSFKEYFYFTEVEIEYLKNYQLKFRLNGELSNYLEKQE